MVFKFLTSFETSSLNRASALEAFTRCPISSRSANQRKCNPGFLDALREFGFAFSDLKIKDFTKSDTVVQLGDPPVRIDMLTSISGVTWNEANAQKIHSGYGGVPVYYIGKTELISNKRATARKKDLADLEALGED